MKGMVNNPSRYDDVCLCLRDLMAELSEKLNQTEESLELVKAEDNSTNIKLDALRDDAQKLQRTVQDLLDQVEFIKNSDIRGTYQEPSGIIP